MRTISRGESNMVNFFIFVICIGLSSASNSKVMSAKFFKGSGLLNKDNILSTTKSKSEMDCGAQCLKGTGCISFAVDGSECSQFSDDSGVLQRGVTQSTVGPTTTELSTTTTTQLECPSSIGYEQYTLDGGWHCLKYNASTFLDAVDVKNACASEGAHLLIPQTRTFLNDLQTMFTENGYGMPILYISGEDIYSNKTYYFHDGSEVPANLFATGHPNNIRGFLRVQLDSGELYMIRSGGTGTGTSPTLCQMY